MSDHNPHDPGAPLTGEPTAEELEAAAEAAFGGMDQLALTRAELDNLKAKNAELADMYLRAQADRAPR